MPVDMDANLEDADWTKQSWDLADYKSSEFFTQIGGYDQLESFRKLPVYKHAVAAGLIVDDEWLGDYVDSESSDDDITGLVDTDNGDTDE